MPEKGSPALNTPLNCIGYGAGGFFALGDHGTILASDPAGDLPPTLALSRAGDGRMNVTLRGLLGRIYRVESTPALNGMAWSNRVVLPLNSSALVWVDPVPPTNAARFYRALMLP